MTPGGAAAGPAAAGPAFDGATIVLCAGALQPGNMPVGLTADEGLIPVGGRPAIAWCLDAIRENGGAHRGVDIVARRANTRLLALLHYKYPYVRPRFAEERGSILTSLATGLAAADPNAPTQVILGDTAILEPFPQEADVLLASRNVKTSGQWCLAERDAAGRLAALYDKKDVPLEGKLALVGYYKFADTALAQRLTQTLLARGETELAPLLAAYAAERPLAVRETAHWLDFGHASGLVRARRSQFGARQFNALRVDASRGVLVKTSGRRQKLLDEANWYRALPPDLAFFAPRVAGVSEAGGHVSIELELYGYQPLSDLFLYGQNKLEDWTDILEALFAVHRLFRNHAAPPDKDELAEIYLGKTARRLERLRATPHLARLMLPEGLTLNGRRLANLPALRGRLRAATAALVGDAPRCVVHGDFCFSNILFDPLNFLFKLIDPRGRFKTQGIYGDPRYDVAKLRHSVVGLYDALVAGLYSLDRTGPAAYELHCPQEAFAAALGARFDRLAEQNGYRLPEIQLIEGLLFLTMIPLHADAPKRQAAFYLTAVRRLNEALNR